MKEKELKDKIDDKREELYKLEEEYRKLKKAREVDEMKGNIGKTYKNDDNDYIKVIGVDRTNLDDFYTTPAYICQFISYTEFSNGDFSFSYYSSIHKDLYEMEKFKEISFQEYQNMKEFLSTRIYEK